jgi:tetratricopeptide (TPR) repeat protein
VYRSPNQKARIYAWVGLSLLLGSFGNSDTSATPSPFGFSNPKLARSLSDSCQALGNSSSQIAELIAKAASFPSGASYDALGQAFAEQNIPTCAISAFEVGLDFDPRMWRTRYTMAVTLLQLGDSKRAISELHAVLEQAPDSFMAHNALGLALENLTNLEGAREEYEKAVILNPHFALGYYNLAHLASAEGRFSAAVFYSQKAVNLDPQEPTYQSALGIALSQDGKFQESIDVLQKLATSHPDFVEAYLNLGAAYGQEKRFPDAVRSYRQAIKLDPENSQNLLLLGIALLANSQQQEALSVFKSYVGR